MAVVIVWVRLELDATADEAVDLVDSAIDSGILEDAINERDGLIILKSAASFTSTGARRRAALDEEADDEARRA